MKVKKVSIIGVNSLNKIATIICNYNYGKYVCDAIKSAVDQTYEDHIVVVVDDGSTDDSLDRIQGMYNDWTVTHSCGQVIWRRGNLIVAGTSNKGASEARNLAIRIAGPVFAIHVLDADDEAMPDKVKIMAEKMLSHNSIGVVYGDYIIDRGTYKKIEYKKPYSYDGLIRECIVHSGSLVRKAYLEAVTKDNQYYNPKLHGPASQGYIGSVEDYDLWLRLSRVCMIVHIPQVLTYVREHGENQSMKMTNEIFAKAREIMNNV